MNADSVDPDMATAKQVKMLQCLFCVMRFNIVRMCRCQVAFAKELQNNYKAKKGQKVKMDMSSKTAATVWIQKMLKLGAGNYNSKK